MMIFKNLFVVASSVLYASTYVHADDGFEGDYGDENVGDEMEGYGGGEKNDVCGDVLYVLPLHPSLFVSVSL